MRLDELQYICGIIYSIDGKFDNIKNFFDYISTYIEDGESNSELSQNRINDIIKMLNENSENAIDQNKALQFLVADELERALNGLKNLNFADPEEELIDYNEKYYNLYSEFFGGDIELPELFIVDKFPSPYGDLKVEALAPDRADEEMYNIPQGIYFLRRSLAPYYSAYVLPHEIIHSIIGKPNPYLLGRGLEEGIADLLGSIYGGFNVLGERVTKNLTIYSRLSHTDPIWALYSDYLRQAAYIYRKYGLNGIRELTLGGREKIKQVEKEIITGNLNFDLHPGNWNKNFDELQDFLLSLYIKNLIVSPLAKYIAPHLSIGTDVSSFLKDHNIDKKAGNDAIYELQRNIFILLINDKEVIDYYDEWISNSLRYRIPAQKI